MLPSTGAHVGTSVRFAVSVITLTPTESGDFGIVCNEYCGIGHHTMTGKIYVTEKTAAQADAGSSGAQGR